MDHVTQLTGCLTMLFSTFADASARLTGFLKRKRKYTAGEFARALVFGWIKSPQARVEDFTDDLNVTPSAIQQRMTKKGVALMRSLLEKACEFVFASCPLDLELTNRFQGIYVEDATSIKLMESLREEFPGCGGAAPGQGAAGLKALLRIEVTTGQLGGGLVWDRQRENDLNLSRRIGDVPPGSLYLADLGFWDTERLNHFTKQGVSWISRVPAGTTMCRGEGPREEVTEFLSRQTNDEVDRWVWVGEKRLKFRLVARRCSAEVAANKKRKLRKTMKKKGREPSQRQLQLCEWLVLVTTLEAEEFSFEELWTLYRARWQIELVFKRWKSGQGLGDSLARTNSSRQLMELYAKLLGCLITHWGSLLRAGLLTRLSWHRMLKIAKQVMGSMKDDWDEQHPLRVRAKLEKLKKRLERIKPRPKRKKKPGTMDLLENPALALN